MDRRRPSRFAALIALLGLGLSAAPIQAGNDAWTVAGQPPGGTVMKVVVNPATPSILYATSGPGVFESTDSGSSWTLVFKTLNGPSDLVIDPLNPDTLYAAYGGDSDKTLFKSTDGGATWNALTNGLGTIFNGTEVDGVAWIAVDPVDEGTVYVVCGNTGVFKTTDGGATWNAINTGITQLQDPNVVINRLLVDPVDPQVLYLSVTEELSPTNSSTVLAGLYQSVDGGAHWAVTSISGRDVGDIEIDPSDHTHLLAVEGYGLVSVTNSGANSTPLASSPPDPSVIRFDPTNDQHLYAGSYTSGMYESTDGGTTFTQLPGYTTEWAMDVALDPVHPSNLYVSTADWGVFKSTDGGASWSPANTGIYNVVVDLMLEGTDDVLYLASAGSGIYRSSDQGATWAEVGGGVTGSLPWQGDFVYALVEDPTATSTLYAGTTGGLFKTTDGGATWTETDSGLYPYFLALAIDPEHTGTIYAGSGYGNGPYKSTDGGATWTTIATGLPMSASDPDSDVQALAVDPADSDVVYAGLFAKGLYKSTDAGATWNVAGTGLPATDVWAIAVDPSNHQVVYASTTAGMYKSTDAGTTWLLSNSGMEGYFMTDIQIDPNDTADIYVSPRYGIGPAFMSTDGGATWNALTGGLPAATQQTASFRPRPLRRVKDTVAGSSPITISSVAVDPVHVHQIFGSGSDGQVYVYDAVPSGTTGGSTSGGSSGGSTGGSSGGGSSGGTPPKAMGGGGGAFDWLVLTALVGLAALRRRRGE